MKEGKKEEETGKNRGEGSEERVERGEEGGGNKRRQWRRRGRTEEEKE